MIDKILYNTKIFVNYKKQLKGVNGIYSAAESYRPHKPIFFSNDEVVWILNYKRIDLSHGSLGVFFEPSRIISEIKKVLDFNFTVIDTNFHSQGGYPHDISYIKRDSPDEVVIARDFWMDPFQIYEAKAYGADGIIIDLSLIDFVPFEKIKKTAEALDLPVYYQVSSIDDAYKVDEGLVEFDNGIVFVSCVNFSSSNLNNDPDMAMKICSLIGSKKCLVIDYNYNNINEIGGDFGDLIDGVNIPYDIIKGNDVIFNIERFLKNSSDFTGFDNNVYEIEDEGEITEAETNDVDLLPFKAKENDLNDLEKYVLIIQTSHGYHCVTYPSLGDAEESKYIIEKDIDNTMSFAKNSLYQVKKSSAMKHSQPSLKLDQIVSLSIVPLSTMVKK